MSSMFNVDERNRYCVGMTIKVVIHKAEEGGFWAEVPALPGCVTQGETMEELRTNLEDAIKLWLEAGEPEIAGIEGDEIVELAI
jgi:predicted RNase H-like HicB family nuclease